MTAIVPLQAIPVADDPFVLLFGSLYLLLVLAIGVWGYLQTESTSDFLITGKSIGTWVLALTAFSVIQSGFGFVGGPELVYLYGTTGLWIFFTAPLGFLVAWVVLAKRMRLLADIRNVLTLADGMYVRYESAWVRGLTAVAVIVGVIAYLATNLAALQFVMRAIFGIPVIWGLISGAAILLVYSALGGMIAGVWTDFVQAITMIVGAVFVFFFALEFGGGMANITQNLASADPALVSPFGAIAAPAASVFTAIAWWILFSVGSAGQPHLITKFYMSRNLTILRWGAPIAAISYAISSMIAFSAGLSMRAAVEAGRIPELQSASVAAPVFVLNYTPGVIAGLVLAALLAAIMSTSDSFLNIGAAAVSRDIPRALGHPIQDDRIELRVTQVALAGLTVLASVVVLYSSELVAILGTIGWGFFAAAFFPIAALGLNWKGATKEGAIVGIVGGLIVNLFYSVIPRIAETVGATELSEAILALYPFTEGFPVGTVALLVAVVLTIGVSLLTQRDQMVPADLVPLLER